MAYSTVVQFVVSYPRMEKSLVSSATMFAWLERASNHIDAEICSAVAAVPVTPIPPLLRDLCEDVAYVSYMRKNVTDAGKNQGIELMWKDTMSRLDNIRNGVITLVTSGVSVSITGRDNSPWSNVSGYTPSFGVSSIEDAETDPDRVDDESDAR